MVTIALKSEALFAIIGVGAVVVTVCVAAALCYTCQRRGKTARGSTAIQKGGELGQTQDGVGVGPVVEDVALTDLPLAARARTRRSRTADVDSAESGSKDLLGPPSDEGTAVTKIEASAFATSLNFPRFELELAPGGGLPTSSTTTTTTTTPFPRQPRLSQSQSARLDPQLFQQTFSTYESFYRAQSETSAASVPPSPSPDPRAAASAGAWPSRPAAAARTREASESRLTAVNATLADIALLPSTPTKLFMAGTGTGASSTIAAAAAAREPDRASSAMHSDTSSPLRRAASGRRRSTSVVVLPPPPAALSPKRRDLSGSEPVPPSPSPPVQIRPPPPLTPTLVGARVPPGPAPAGGSALASRPRPRSRSVGASIIVPPPPPAYPPEALGRGQKYPPPTARSRDAAAAHPKRSLDGGTVRVPGGLLGGRPVAKSASASVRRRPATAPQSVSALREPPRSYFDD